MKKWVLVVILAALPFIYNILVVVQHSQLKYCETDEDCIKRNFPTLYMCSYQDCFNKNAHPLSFIGFRCPKDVGSCVCDAGKCVSAGYPPEYLNLSNCYSTSNEVVKYMRLCHIKQKNTLYKDDCYVINMPGCTLDIDRIKTYLDSSNISSIISIEDLVYTVSISSDGEVVKLSSVAS